MNADNHEEPLIVQIADGCCSSVRGSGGRHPKVDKEEEDGKGAGRQRLAARKRVGGRVNEQQQQRQTSGGLSGSSSSGSSDGGAGSNNEEPTSSSPEAQCQSVQCGADKSDTRGQRASSLLAARGGNCRIGEEWPKEAAAANSCAQTTAQCELTRDDDDREKRSRFSWLVDSKESNEQQLVGVVPAANQLNHLTCASSGSSITIEHHQNRHRQHQQPLQQQVEQALNSGNGGEAGAGYSSTIESQVATTKDDGDRSTATNSEPTSRGINLPACQDEQQQQATAPRQQPEAQIQSQQQQAASALNSQEYQAAPDSTGASLLFWKFLSNLPTSITQRGKSPPELAPEVTGYLANKQLQQQQQRQKKCDASMAKTTSTSTTGAVAAATTTTTTNTNTTTNNNNNNKTILHDDDNRPPPYDGCSRQQEMIMLNYSSGAAHRRGPPTAAASNAAAGSRLIRIVAPQPELVAATQQRRTSPEAGDHQLQSSSEVRDRLTEDQQQQQQQQQHLQANQRTKLSIASSRTTSRSSATSLSSCVLSNSSSSTEVVRLKWGKKMDFLLSIIGFAVDLANIWRFPYLVYKNGGGVFLIPYLTMLVFGGIPLFFLELCLGQFVKKGPITVWNKICPSMKGVGYCSIMISWYVSFYYNVLIAWSVYFIYRSLQSSGDKLPWEDCDNSWNSRGTCVSISQLKELCSHRVNVSLETCRKELFNNVNVTSPASEFFVKELSQIDQSTGLDDMGYLRWELVFCTMIVYLLHYFSLFRGLETSGKVVWVTATAPYMILSILLVRGLFLPGATMGIEYYLSPRLEKLADPQVWIDAAGQVFYSIGVGFGVHLTYASFNSHNNNCYRDCLMTSAVNALTSVYSGLVVFVYLGYMAKNLGIEIDKVASEGYSLVFEVYPEALTTLPFARFWSILFFIMLLTLGIDSAMGGLEAVITGLEDEFKFARRLSRGQLTGLVIVSSFLPALISCTQGGAYTLFWFDIYSAGVSLLFSALFETIGVVYCYGLDKFIPNIESMLGRKPPLFYIVCWKYISPIFLGGVIFMSIYTAGVPTYRGYTFPLWSIILGWCLAFSSVAAIPIVAIWYWGRRWLMGSSLDKSGRRRDRGSSSAASSRHGSSKKSPSHRSVSVSCGLQSQGGLTNTITSVLAKSPSTEHNKTGDKYPGLGDSIEDML